MSSLWTDLLFLHGHIHDPELARRLATTPPPPLPSLPGGKRQRTRSPFAVLASLYSSLRVAIGHGRAAVESGDRAI